MSYNQRRYIAVEVNLEGEKALLIGSYALNGAKEKKIDNKGKTRSGKL